MAPLLLALRDASATEPDAKQVWGEISDRRAANMRLLAQDLEAAGGLVEPGSEGWVHDALPQATVEVCPSSGHFPHLANPGRFAEWLASTGQWS